MAQKIEEFLNKIICGDCFKIIPAIPNDSIDLCLTSVPFNVNLGSNKFNDKPYDLYNDNKEHSEYIAWLKGLFSDIYKKLKKGGRCVINIGDGQNGKIPTHVDITHFMTKEIGYLPMATIVWDKKNVTSRTAWGSFKSPAAPSFPKPFEYILIFAKETYHLQTKGITDLTNEEFIDWSSSLWTFPAETRISKKVHPAPFPEELPRRCIKMLSWKGAVVLDPFMGSGTTARVCKKLERNYIGIELSPTYHKLAEKRTRNVVIADTLFNEETDEPDKDN